MSRAQYQAMARRAAMEYDLPPELFMGLVQQESGWNPNARSEAGAYGLTQIMPDTARDPGLGVRGITPDQMRDPMSQLRFGARYFKALLNRYDGDTDKALAAYNWGIRRVDKKGADPSVLPEETRDYLTKVKGYADDFGGNYLASGPDVAVGNPDDFTSGYDTMAMFGGEGGGGGPAGSGGGSGGNGSYSAQAGLSGAPTAAPGRRADGAANAGDYIGAGLRGLAMGGPIGATTSLIGTALGSAMSQRHAAAEKARTEAGLPADDGKFGLDDAMRSGLRGYSKGGIIGAGAGVIGGFLGNMFGPNTSKTTPQAGLGYSTANSLAAGNATNINDPLGAALNAAFNSPVGGGYVTANGVSMQGPDDALGAALDSAIGGGASSGASSFGGDGYGHGSDDNRGGARGW